jgi:hypothetical protein
MIRTELQRKILSEYVVWLALQKYIVHVGPVSNWIVFHDQFLGF